MIKEMQTEQIDMMRLLAVARGEVKADLVLKGGYIFNSFTGEWETGDIAVYGNTIAGIGVYSGAKEIDLVGSYVTPGFMDAHLHIESTMVAPRELAKILLLNGVTTIFADPHEIANVLGRQGIELMLAETEGMPLDVFFMLPSCVPATDMETSGAVLTADDLQPLRTGRNDEFPRRDQWRTGSFGKTGISARRFMRWACAGCMQGSAKCLSCFRCDFGA